MSIFTAVILWAIVVTCLMGLGALLLYHILHLVIPLRRWLFDEETMDDE